MRAFHARTRFAAAALLLAAFFTSPLLATSVAPPSFDQLVTKAELIVRGRVVDVHAAWADSPQGRVIKTYVTFAVQRALKGAPGAQLTLSFLGGEIDGQGMRISGMPQFVVGQTEILFVAGNGVRFCPLVAMMHGRYHVQSDAATGREFIARNDGVPLLSEHDVELPQTGNPLERQLRPVSAALSAAAFEQSITQQLTRRVAQP